jgi:hypothetical protein
MRTSHVASTLVAVTAGLTAVTALHRRSGRRRPAPVLDTVGGGVVLPFARPVPVAATAPVAPEPAARLARCGDSGGRTKGGAPCGARATAEGRCHHHRQAA